MNRRSFLTSIIQAGVGPMILPSAMTYSRRWIQPKQIIVPHWYQTHLSRRIIDQGYVELFEMMMLKNTEFKDLVEMNQKWFPH